MIATNFIILITCPSKEKTKVIPFLKKGPPCAEQTYHEETPKLGISN